MIELLSRTAHLVALVFAPRLPSPDPGAPSGVMALFGAIALVAPLAAAIWLLRRFDTVECKAAVGLFVLADVALLYEAQATLAAGTPLLGGYYLAAPPLWAGLGAVLAALAGQYLGVSFKNKRTGAFVITVAIGIFLFRDANGLIASRDDQWAEVLARDPAHERALTAQADALVRGWNDAGDLLERCVRAKPDSCICRTLRAERRLSGSSRGAQFAIDEIDRGSCNGHPMAVRGEGVRAVALALLGRADAAEAIYKQGLDKRSADAKLLYARALVLEQRHDPGALDAARAAVDQRVGPGAELLVAQILIETNDLAGATVALKAYVDKYPDDPRGLYDAALVADRLSDYNAAREGYYKTLKIDPSFADARYNLTILTFKAGAVDEAKNHARRFAQAFPDDPRRLYLLNLVGLTE